MKLFEPITIRSMVLPNRIVYPAIQLNMGLNGRRARAFYSERAKGGAGLILTANTAIDNFACEDLWGGSSGLNDFIKRLRVFTSEVHSAGGKIGVQLWQANRFPQGRGVQKAGKEMDPNSGDRIAPSAMGDMRALTLPEIDSIIYRFAKGARNIRDAGFDCVEIHGAHSYLLAQFSNAATNQRTDQFGGDLTGRMKMGIDIIKAMRAFVGPEFPILYRLGALEENGRIHPDSLIFARELEKAGVDGLDISTAGWGPNPVTPTKKQPMGTFVYLAEPIKKAVKIPVIAVGRINKPEVAESILKKGQADMVAIGRQLIADPYWPLKVKENRFTEVIKCDSCNINCSAPAFERKLPPDAPLCKNNPGAGREWEAI
ncbi:MAG: NADH:flavin oxidoreductase [Thermodesulfobacteriota bacterium]